MNANRYRLIFDKKTGMLVPVAEFTASAKKGNARGHGDGMGDTTTPKWSRLGAAMAVGFGGLGVPLSLSAQMVVDPSSGATLNTGANGVPLINIVDPNASGLSHNRFQEFNVGTDGAVFNNSLHDGRSQIGGHVMKNPHLTREATGILTEVTGTDISRIQGAMEVFGGKADLLIANPKGASVAGDKGLYLSNTLSMPINNVFSGFVGADVGVVQDSLPDAARQVISGFALGLRGNWKHASFSVTHAEPMQRVHKSARDVLYATATVRF
jgi:filamentous hemagglutinin